MKQMIGYIILSGTFLIASLIVMLSKISYNTLSSGHAVGWAYQVPVIVYFLMAIPLFIGLYLVKTPHE